MISGGAGKRRGMEEPVRDQLAGGGVESVGDELCGMSRSFLKYNFRVILE